MDNTFAPSGVYVKVTQEKKRKDNNNSDMDTTAQNTTTLKQMGLGLEFSKQM